MAIPVENVFIPPHIPGERMVNFLQDAKRKKFAGMPCTRELMITAAGYHPHAEGHHCIRPRGSRGYVFLYCIDGKGWAKFDRVWGGGMDKKDRKEISVGRNQSVFLRPGCYHEYGASEDNPWSYYYIHYEGTLAAEYTQMILEQKESGSYIIQESEEYLRDFCLILENLEKGWNYPQMVMASACLHKLLSYIYLRKIESVDEIQITSAKTRVQSVAEMIEENPQNQLSVLELARAANLSVSRFNELFKEVVGSSPKQFALQMKLEKSKELLERSDLCIYEISDRVGFEDCHYFSRIFSRKTGMTPSDYRSKHGDTVPGPDSVDAVEK
jgi:AraC family transcriptional regulator of arabinose operon